jgi:hypothetical protein
LKLDPEHPYLAERGISRDLVERFGLGFCEKGIMAGRICIPIHNIDGQTVAYAGRWVGRPEELPEGAPPASASAAQGDQPTQPAHLLAIESAASTTWIEPTPGW